jgi:hypothetical protein
VELGELCFLMMAFAIEEMSIKENNAEVKQLLNF